MKVNLRRIYMVVTFGLLSYGAVFPAAAAVVYDEAVSGDLSDLPPLAAFGLQLGMNSIKGTQFSDDTGPVGCCSDFDSFIFAVPAGMHLASVSYEFRTTGGSLSSSTEFALQRGSESVGAQLADQEIDLDAASSTVELFASALPLSTGTYMINNSLTVEIGQNWSADYTINLLVASGAVPEPPTYVVLITGLIIVLSVRASRGRS